MITQEQVEQLELVANRLTRRAHKNFSGENTVKYFDGIYQDILQELINAAQFGGQIESDVIKSEQYRKGYRAALKFCRDCPGLKENANANVTVAEMIEQIKSLMQDWEDDSLTYADNSFLTKVAAGEEILELLNTSNRSL